MPKMAATVVIDGKHAFYVEWDCDHDDCHAQDSHALDEVRGEAQDVVWRAMKARPEGFVVAAVWEVKVTKEEGEIV